ncbi:MAG: M56 family metallopeptidase [Bacteroidota bacterium]
MSLYLLKIILGSGLLWVIYHFWLQNAKMFRFNRAYLILALIAAYTVPLLPLHSVEIDGGQVFVVAENGLPQAGVSEAAELNLAPSLQSILFMTWGLVSLVFFLRFGKNLFTIWRSVRRRRAEKIGPAKLIYLPEQQGPYSFGNYIFLAENKREGLDPVLLTHEMAHVEQRHSWDILFIEFLVILSWFNPFVYLFKKSIRLNHEFLADQAVVEQHNNRQTYPYLILQHASSQAPMALSSAFHYINLKKRLSMITKKQSSSQIRLKQFSLIPLLGVFLFVFAGEALAQTPPPPPPPKEKAKADIPPPPPPVKSKADIPPPPPPVKADKDIPPPPPPTNFSFDKPGYRGMTIVIKSDNGEKKVLRYEDMTDAQKRQYLPPPPPKPVISNPSYSEYLSWRDASQYGIWLDGKRIDNSELANYKASDIAMFNVSRLAKNAKNFGKHTYQLTAWTERGYEKLLKEWYDKWGD